MNTTNFIDFPGLGFSLQINRVAFSVFGKDIYWYGIIIAAGFICGTLYALWRAKKERISADTVFDLVLWGMPVSILFARIFYVMGDWQAVLGSPWRFFAVWEGGIAIYGAIMGAVLVGVTYCKANKLDTGRIFDLCAPALMIGQIAGRWGNFVNAEVYGVSTDLPWAMSINGEQSVHPLFLYESLWMLAGLLGVLLYYRHKKRSGEIFAIYILWYGLGRFWLEGLRNQEFILRLGTLPLSQVTALVSVLAAAGLLWYLYAKKPEAGCDEGKEACASGHNAECICASKDDAPASGCDGETGANGGEEGREE